MQAAGASFVTGGCGATRFLLRASGGDAEKVHHRAAPVLLDGGVGGYLAVCRPLAHSHLWTPVRPPLSRGGWGECGLASPFQEQWDARGGFLLAREKPATEYGEHLLLSLLPHARGGAEYCAKRTKFEAVARE